MKDTNTGLSVVGESWYFVMYTTMVSRISLWNAHGARFGPTAARLQHSVSHNGMMDAISVQSMYGDPLLKSHGEAAENCQQRPGRSNEIVCKQSEDRRQTIGHGRSRSSQ